MDEGWGRILGHIIELHERGLTSIMLLAHATERRVAPLQHHQRPLWEFTGEASDPLRTGSPLPHQDGVAEIVRACTTKAALTQKELPADVAPI